MNPTSIHTEAFKVVPLLNVDPVLDGSALLDTFDSESLSNQIFSTTHSFALQSLNIPKLHDYFHKQTDFYSIGDLHHFGITYHGCHEAFSFVRLTASETASNFGPG